MERAYTLEVFPVVIYKKNIKHHPNRDEIINDTEFYREEDAFCWFSSSKDILSKYPDLERMIMHEFINYVQSVFAIDTSKVDFYISRSWVVKHKTGDFATSHNHVNSVFSGILYLNVDETSGDLSFPRQCLNNVARFNINNFKFDTTGINPNNADHVRIKPDNGDLIMFPSNIYHEVLENQSSIDRYALALDIFFRGTIGQKEYRLTI